MEDSQELQDFFDHARDNMFPNMKSSAFCMTILGDPDPKLCMEVGAAILFDKPIIVIARHGQTVPLSLRTIVHKIVEISEDMNDADRATVSKAVTELMEAKEFRPKRSAKKNS